MKNVHNKVAVITGAGIGQALAIALAREGTRLALSDIDEAGLARTRSQLPASSEVRLYRLDVTDRQAVDTHAARALRR
ncbi:SDR family NAD(P)-dependent oxidoreductase [Pseudomonas paeninsulae]|uniref:SDR family NAD(P)-dependent oxidoreductase n=1 Tax=Pseudomonas paeninsulae TaxID=3110772 RepID=UPI002D79E3DF|nr:SDR family NAD(P)-dependent oxidoreductase [Pseudomonas sp. IT1137]